MMKKYTCRERVRTALNHLEPDQVPCDITITPDAYARLCKHLGTDLEPRDWDDWNHVFPSPEVLEKLGVDVYHLPLKMSPAGFNIHLEEFRDQWGILKRKVHGEGGSIMYNMVDAPLRDAGTVADILNYKWPKPEELIDVSGMVEMTKNLYDNTEFALTATFGGNIFERAHYLRGMENFFMDLLADEEMAGAVMDKILEIQMKVDQIILSAIGRYLTYFRFNGEDMGSQNAPLISIDLFQRLVRPRLETEWKAASAEFRKHNPDGKIAIHSCGAVFDFIPLYIEMGADILNPVQPNARGMNTALIKKLYGDRICFHGGIDTQTVLANGTIDQVREEVRVRIRDLAPSGGYIVAPSHNIQHGMSPENIVAMYDAVREFGKYGKIN